MPISGSLRRWLRLPGRAALILGLGAVPTIGARADAPDPSNLGSFGNTSIRSEGGRIYFSEGGQETELQLGPTPQRDHLLRVLEEHGPAGIKLNADPRLIISGGGGSGFTLRDLQRSIFGEPSPAPQNSRPTGAPKREPAPRGHKEATDKKG